MKTINIIYGLEAFEGGVLKHVEYLCNGLDKNKFCIHILTSLQKSPTHVIEKFTKLKKNGIIISHIPLSHRIRLTDDYKCIRDIVSYIRTNNIDIVHAHSSKAGALFRAAASLSKVKSIYTPHCYYFISQRGLSRLLFKLTERLLGLITHRTILAENEKSLASDKIVKMHSITIINNAIDKKEYSKYNRTSILNKYAIPSGKIIIGGIGRLEQQKNWNIFLLSASRIVKMVPNAFFIIAGEGKKRKELEELTEKLGILKNVKFLGHINDISEVFSILDIFVSTSDWEGLPYSYLEAYHYNIPMFISHTNDIEKILSSKHSIIYPKQDYGYLADEICRFIRTKERLSPRLLVDDSLENFLRIHQEVYMNAVRGF